MLTIGYEQLDGSVKYLYTSDDTLQNLLTEVVYNDSPLPSKVYNRDELKQSSNLTTYFSQDLSDEEDTRFRFLRLKDNTWLIRDFYGNNHHDIIIKKTQSLNIKGGSRKTRRQVRKNEKIEKKQIKFNR
jgi:DNA-directed RNA polymerase delta subunit